LLASATALRIPVATAALALGVALSGEAQARTTVNPVRNSTYTLNPELKWRNNWSVAATFEGEFSSVTSSRAGKGVVRYQW
jgi:hypothetical protein